MKSTEFVGLVLKSDLTWNLRLALYVRELHLVILSLKISKKYYTRRKLLMFCYGFNYPYLKYGIILRGNFSNQE